VQRAGLHDQALATPAWVRRRGLGQLIGKSRSRICKFSPKTRKRGETPTRWVGLSLNRWVVLSIHLSCAIRGDPHTCGWDDCTRGHRWQTRSRRLNLALAAARPPGRVTATAAMGVRFLVVRCVVWQSEPHRDCPGDTAADRDLTRPRRCFRREGVAGWDSTTGLHKRTSPAFP
jgi:hypothetical protein